MGSSGAATVPPLERSEPRPGWPQAMIRARPTARGRKLQNSQQRELGKISIGSTSRCW